MQYRIKSFSSNFQKILFLVILSFLLVVLIEQGWKYAALRNQIGMYVYSSPYALRIIGKKNEYIGRIVDVRWNAMPADEEDIKGLQPRYSIARETIQGTTETKWVCSYLVRCSTAPPAKYTPSPFPPITFESIAYR